jgi:hypothetical protein
MNKKMFALWIICCICLLTQKNAFARCAPSFAYHTEFEILSCQDEDPKDHSKILEGHGVILEVTVSLKTRINGPEVYDWWPAESVLPVKMHVFYDTNEKPACALLRPGTKRKGKMSALCCDGGEPRCNYGVAAYTFDLEK